MVSLMNHLSLEQTVLDGTARCDLNILCCLNMFQRETLLLNRLEISGNTFCVHQQQQNKWWLSARRRWVQLNIFFQQTICNNRRYQSRSVKINILISVWAFCLENYSGVRFLMSPFKFKSSHKIEHYMPYKTSTQPELEKQNSIREWAWKQAGDIV